jgi:hypothetical protein
MQMYRGSESVDVHPSQIDTMKNRGWSASPDKKPSKTTKPKEVKTDG